MKVVSHPQYYHMQFPPKAPWHETSFSKNPTEYVLIHLIKEIQSISRIPWLKKKGK
jgi:hypothetical protein